jgi:hypothetical protein
LIDQGASKPLGIRSRKNTGAVSSPRRLDQSAQRNEGRSNVNSDPYQERKQYPKKPPHDVTLLEKKTHAWPSFMKQLRQIRLEAPETEERGEGARLLELLHN